MAGNQTTMCNCGHAHGQPCFCGLANRKDYENTTAEGVVGIYTDAVGNVIRSVSDFDQSGYGGFSKQEAQKFRVKRQLAFAVVRAYCSDPILKTLDDYQCEEILNKLVKNGGKATYIPVGYKDE